MTPPLLSGYTPDQHKEQCLLDLHEVMANYGKACREAALEEAAQAAESVDLHRGNALKNSNPRKTCAEAIRGLKEKQSMFPKADSGTSTDWSAA